MNPIPTHAGWLFIPSPVGSWWYEVCRAANEDECRKILDDLGYRYDTKVLRIGEHPDDKEHQR